MKGEKARRECDHGVRRIECGFMGDFEDLWKYLERGDSQEHSGRKSHDEMETVLELEGDETSKKNRSEGDERKDGGIGIHNAKSDDKTEYNHFFLTPNVFVQYHL